MLNGRHGTGSSLNRRPEGQIWKFSGANKPTGRFVGYKFYEGGINGRLDCYELGVTGAQKLRFIRPEQLDTRSGKHWAEKFALLNAGAALNGTTLQVDDITDATLAAIPGENLIAELEVAGAVSGSTTLKKSSGQLAQGIDRDIYDTTGTNTTLSGTNGFTVTGSSATEKGAARFETGNYHSTLTLTLDGETKIDKIYAFAHPRVSLSWSTYKIYVSNDKETLYDDKNEVAYFDYYEGYKGKVPNLSLNGSESPGTDYGRSDGQIWSFEGDKPFGSYVGIKIFEGQVGFPIPL